MSSVAIEVQAACERERSRWRLAVRRHRAARAAVDREAEAGQVSPDTRAALERASRALLVATRAWRVARDEREAALAPSG